VTFEAVEPGYVPSGSWDAVVIADVLYLLPEEQQTALVVGAAAVTRPGGVVVLKEMGLEPKWKFGWNRAQETLATRVFKVTDSIGHGMTFVEPDTMAVWLRNEGLDVEHHRVDHGYPWPHHLVVGRRPSQG
jgi:2-polyprenyl-3-methyl-5-hydroxy-6-metoxy-1,4-benzoquinol methylase